MLKMESQVCNKYTGYLPNGPYLELRLYLPNLPQLSKIQKLGCYELEIASTFQWCAGLNCTTNETEMVDPFRFFWMVYYIRLGRNDPFFHKFMFSHFKQLPNTILRHVAKKKCQKNAFSKNARLFSKWVPHYNEIFQNDQNGIWQKY